MINSINALRNENEKFEQLCQKIESYQGMVVAFSGGVDSTFLIALASALTEHVMALTVKSPYIATWEIDEAFELTMALGVKHELLTVAIPESIKNNPVDRCYLCKHEIFSNIKRVSQDRGYSVVCDGSNHDDLGDYRPGMRALKELEISSPLLECGITKAEIRAWSLRMNLPTWDKPPYACLLTRLPYDTFVDLESLRLIEKSEAFIISKGIRAIRVRKQDTLARIEIEKSEMHKILDQKLMEEISSVLKGFGFEYVTLDLGGYQMGSFNSALTKG